VLDAAGYRDHRLNACGYSLGATFTPTWMDWPMFYERNPVEAAPNMIFFIHIILANSDTRRAMTLGQTVRVTQSGCERLSRVPIELVVN
jgi:Xaa-Pro dipeptidase